MAGFEADVIDLLYGSLLGRAPSGDDVANCSSFLRNGGTVADLKAAILRSKEYLAKQDEAASSHPLSHIDSVWKPNRISYFTHRGKYRPLSLTVETVNICNNDCIICPYSSQTRRKQTMPMDVFETILKQYSQIGGGPLGLTPMVGEVLLDKRLAERLDLIVRYPAVTAVSAISNASMAHLYDDAELAAILGHLDRLTVSVYGLDEAEFRTMTRKEGYARFLQGLTRILGIMGPERIVLAGRQLVARPRGAVDAWLRELAVAAGVAPDRLTMETTTAYANWGRFDTANPLPHDATWMPGRQNTVQCALPLISAQVLSDGTTSFCGCANFDGTSELNIGNVMEQSLKDMMASDKVRALWDWPKCGTPEFCKTCTFHMPISVVGGVQAFEDPLGAFGG